MPYARRFNNEKINRYEILCVSQPPGRGPVPGPSISYTGSREIILEMINNLNVILYLSTCHTFHINALILFVVMPYLIITIYVSLMLLFY